MRNAIRACSILALISLSLGCAGTGSTGTTALTGANAVGANKTTITLPKNIDPSGEAHVVARGTRIYAVPRYVVTYSSDTKSAEMAINVYGTISTTITDGHLVITNDAGYKWTFPSSATTRQITPALAFVAPGQPGPKIVRSLQPIAVAP